MSDSKKPAEKVIEAFGGVTKLSLVLGCGKSTVSCWATRGNGLIPTKWQAKILNAAKDNGIDILPSDLVDY